MALIYWPVKFIAFDSIGIFNDDRQGLRSLLLRLALSDASPSSRALLQSALALSSLHRYGLRAEAFRLRVSALHALEASIRSGISASEGIQHVAAGMILCYFEIQDIHDTDIQWIWYVCGSSHLMRALQLRDRMRSSEFSAILDWVDYHVVVGKFALKHWHRIDLADLYAQNANGQDVQPVVCRKKKVTDVSTSPHEIIRLLHELFDTIVKTTNLTYHSPEYAESLRNLESRILNVSTDVGTTDEHEHMDASREIVELYKLAALIYLERVSKNFSGRSDKIDSYVERAFEILGKSPIWNLPLPLFLFGCEARTDERRWVIMEIIEQTAKSPSSRSLEGVRRMVQAVWVQDDLETNNELDYVTKLDAVVTSNAIIPTFA
ncbi:fungal-specific transcription factor domain-containing protein [Xylariales sp. AK1849]|nr:fungal-specific transcription factor domain-containing protein [Xylariales sp. AK1849]